MDDSKTVTFAEFSRYLHQMHQLAIVEHLGEVPFVPEPFAPQMPAGYRDDGNGRRDRGSSACTVVLGLLLTIVVILGVGIYVDTARAHEEELALLRSEHAEAMRQHQVSLKLSDDYSKRELHQVKALLDLAIEDNTYLRSVRAQEDEPVSEVGPRLFLQSGERLAPGEYLQNSDCAEATDRECGAGTDGDGVAVGSCGASRREHYFLHVSKGGKLVITKGGQFTKSFILKISTIFGKLSDDNSSVHAAPNLISASPPSFYPRTLGTDSYHSFLFRAKR